MHVELLIFWNFISDNEIAVARIVINKGIEIDSFFDYIFHFLKFSYFCLNCNVQDLILLIS